MCDGTTPATGQAPALFREEALRHSLQAEEGRGLVRVSPPWTWTLLAVVLSGLGTALLASFIGRVEVNGRGRGILRPRSGIRMVVAQLDGTVGRIEVHSGQRVKAGSLMVRIEAPQVLARQLEAGRELEAVRRHFKLTAALQDKAHAEQATRLSARIAKIREQNAFQRGAIGILERNLERNLALEREGVQSPARVDEARERLAEARRQLSQSEEALERAAQEVASLDHGRQESLWQRRQTIQHAEVRSEALSFLLGQTAVEAPDDGVVEAMLVRPGEVVRAGQAICKLIPHQAPLQAVAFLDEKDRAFVHPGQDALLELDQLPYAEYGTVRARIERISDDLASPFEIREALGDHPWSGAPSFRVELTVTDARAARKAGIPLRSGMLVQARFTLRRQRLITLVLDPLRRWFR